MQNGKHEEKIWKWIWPLVPIIAAILLLSNAFPHPSYVIFHKVNDDLLFFDLAIFNGLVTYCVLLFERGFFKTVIVNVDFSSINEGHALHDIQDGYKLIIRKDSTCDINVDFNVNSNMPFSYDLWQRLSKDIRLGLKWNTGLLGNLNEVYRTNDKEQLKAAINKHIELTGKKDPEAGKLSWSIKDIKHIEKADNEGPTLKYRFMIEQLKLSNHSISSFIACDSLWGKIFCICFVQFNKKFLYVKTDETATTHSI